MSEPAPERLDLQQVQAIFDASPFLRFLQLRAAALDHAAGTLTVTMPMRAEFERRPGTAQFHGGPLAAFIDIVGDFAVGMMVGGGVPTINLRIDYLKPAIGRIVTGTARVRRVGRTVALVDVDVFDEQQALVAVGRGTYSPQRG
ncbi:MAG TPA: PaaI family thioesterase [Candidatus Bathyarchaeia archaeon]|nr:PaaI family thioesterase [Candidatus Bathyarchaeia archaeon]